MPTYIKSNKSAQQRAQ